MLPYQEDRSGPVLQQLEDFPVEIVDQEFVAPQLIQDQQGPRPVDQGQDRPLEAVKVETAALAVRDKETLVLRETVALRVSDRQKTGPALVGGRHMGEALASLIGVDMPDGHVAGRHGPHIIDQMLDKGGLARADGPGQEDGPPFRPLLFPEAGPDKAKDLAFVGRVGE